MLIGAALKRKLLALEHPQADTISELDEEGFRVLIVWLENRKIRFYTEDDRAPLASVKGAEWEGALLKYLDELGAGKPSIASDTAKVQVVDWLASQAIGMEYSDHSSKFSKIKTQPAAHASAPSSQPPATKPPAPAPSKPQGEEVVLDLESPEFVEALHQLADLLNVPRDDSPEAMLRQVASVIRTRLPPDEAPSPAPKSGSKRSSKRQFDLGDYPPGFDTGDAALNKAASVLRLFYVADLRRLQDGVNDIISQMQEYTANPKTDSSLGRVGY